MARKPRVEFEGALYHVIARGNNRQQIFQSDEDFLYYLNSLRKAKNRYDFYLYGYCLMPNHLHLLIQTKEIPLSRIMRAIQTSYARYFNQKNKRIGHVFQSRYKAILCDADTYLLELVRYIHLNPVRAGLVKKPQDYTWSSHRDYISSSSTIADTSVILMMFGNTETRSKHNFSEFVLEWLQEGRSEDFYRVVDQRFLGSNDFIKDAKLIFSDINAGRPLICSTPGIDLKDILSLTAEHLNIAESDISGKAQSIRIALARHVFIYIAKEGFNFSCEEIANFLKRDASGMSHAVRKLRERINSDKDLKSIIDELYKRLTV